MEAMMQVFVKTGAIERHQINKEVAKPAALNKLKSMVDNEGLKSTDSWWKQRIDWSEAAKNARMYKKNLDRVIPERLTPVAKDTMWKKAKQLKDEFMIGMLSKEELHPVKGFTKDGKMVWVVDEAKMHEFRSVERNEAWYKKNQDKIREFKNLMRHLCPENPNAGDIERFRPRLKNTR
jgi:hypothetical protein